MLFHVEILRKIIMSKHFNSKDILKIFYCMKCMKFTVQMRFKRRKPNKLSGKWIRCTICENERPRLTVGESKFFLK